MYFSPADEALDIAQSLFASPRGRLGRLDRSRVDPDFLEGLRERRQDLSMIRFEGGPSDKYGHSYFRTNPAVSADIVLMLRYELSPGTPERPLQDLGGGFWKIPPGYPSAK